MKNLTLVFTLIGAIQSSCSAQAVPDKNVAPIPDGYYYGTDKLFNTVFIKVSNEQVIADFIHIEKFPRSLYSDTLTYDKNSNAWKGKTTSFTEKGGTYKITRGKATIRVRPDEAYYKKEADRMKNAGYARAYYEQFVKKNSNNAPALQQYKVAEQQFDMSTIVKTLKHEDFVKEFEKFKATVPKN